MNWRRGQLSGSSILAGLIGCEGFGLWCGGRSGRTGRGPPGEDRGADVQLGSAGGLRLSPMAENALHRLATDTDNGMLLIISGPSGVGKTTITRGVERSIPDSVFSVSWTTRDRTPADVEGVDYHFVSDEEFERYREVGGFLESAGVYGRKYGTPREWVVEQLKRGRLVILEIDVQGAVEVKQRMPEAFAVFIEPPSEGELLDRLRSRNRENEALIQKRFGRARHEIQSARESGVYDVFLVNHRLEEAIDRAIMLVREERGKRSRRIAESQAEG